MEPEELNIYLNDTTYNDYISRYKVDLDSNIKDNVNNKLVIPDNFKKVLKKTIDKLDEVTIENYQQYIVYDPMTFEPIPRFTVRVNLIFFWDVNHGLSREKLDDIINTSFQMMYTDKENIKFSVKDIIIPKRDYEREFIEFFIQK